MKKFTAAILFVLSSASSVCFALPEYAAYSGSNCMACHVGPIGGSGRKVNSPHDLGYLTDKVSLSGDLIFMSLYDQRAVGKDRVIMFPMQGALHLAITPKPVMTIAATQDFGILREAYAMLHNEEQTRYVRAGYFQLPYGLLFEDHTSFVKEGRVEVGRRDFEEKGIGAGLFGVRYKDSGVEAGLSGRPFFANLAVTSGVVGQEKRTFPSSRSRGKRALTERAGFITRHFSLGLSNYSNDAEELDRRISRYGAFGWITGGPFALLFEHDRGRDESFTIDGSTEISASYAELVYAFRWPQKNWQSYARVRYERLDPNRSLDHDILQRWVFSLRVTPWPYLSFEGFYRKNKEQPVDTHNDDAWVLTHLSF